MKTFMPKTARALLSALLLAVSSLALASGIRHLELSEETINDFPETEVTQLLSAEYDTYYVGSHKGWHIFAHQATDASGGMPWTHTWGIKISADALSVGNGWQLRLDSDTPMKTASPYSCPEITAESLNKNMLALPRPPSVGCIE